MNFVVKRSISTVKYDDMAKGRFRYFSLRLKLIIQVFMTQF